MKSYKWKQFFICILFDYELKNQDDKKIYSEYKTIENLSIWLLTIIVNLKKLLIKLIILEYT